jgi:hypothetical protein
MTGNLCAGLGVWRAVRTCALGIWLVAAICGCGSRTPLAIEGEPVAHQIPALLPAGPDGRAWEEMQGAWITLDRTEGVAPALNREALGHAGVSSSHDKGPALVLALETSDSMLWSLRQKQQTLAKDLVAALPDDVRVTVLTVDWLVRTLVEDGSPAEIRQALDRVASVVSAGRFSARRLREPLARIADRVRARFVLFLGTNQSDFLSLGGEDHDEQDEDDPKAQEGDWFFKPKPGPLHFSGPLRYLGAAECRGDLRFVLNWNQTRPLPDPLYPPRRWPDEAAEWSRSRQVFAEAYDRLLAQQRPWIQGCLRDEQNSAPGDPSVDAILTVDASGAVRDIVMDSAPAYRGSRECLRSRLRAFDFPALAAGETQVRFTFTRPDREGRRERTTDIACQSRADAKMQWQAAKLFGLSYWAHPAHLAWMAWAQNRQGFPELASTILVARLLHSAGNSVEALRALSEVASWCPAVASHLAQTWGFSDDASDMAQLSPDLHRRERLPPMCNDALSPTELLESQRRECAPVAHCLQVR